MEEKKEKGHIHLLNSIMRQGVNVLSELGFVVADGPELESEFYNFDALNVPGDHPARDMQDTFWLKGSKKGLTDKTIPVLLRTQTSSVQIRFMENNKPPIRIVVPGKVFRNEATDATHEMQFHQMEGLMVDEKVSMAELKGTLELVFKKLLGDDVKIRFRPSFFPFVEPGMEVDVWFKNRWLECGGAGMVHPNVLRSCGIDSKKYRGFAFGLGPTRIAMIKYGIDDIRLFYSGDLRLVSQF